MRRLDSMAMVWRSIAACGFVVPICVAVSLWSVSTRVVFAAPPQANIGGGLQNVGSGYFGQTGVSFGFGIPTSMPNGGSGVVGLTPQGAFAPGIMLQAGGQPNIPFGLGPTTPGASFGYAANTPLGTAFFSLTASQGANRGNMMGSASITTIDGGTGFISDTSQSPFVTSVVPVVGDGNNSANSPPGARLRRLAGGESPTAPAQLPRTEAQRGGGDFSRQLAAAQGSSAGQPATSMAEIRAEQAAEDQQLDQENRQKIHDAEAALASGKPGVARLFYQQVVRHARGAARQQAIDALKAMSQTSAPKADASQTEAVPAGGDGR